MYLPLLILSSGMVSHLISISDSLKSFLTRTGMSCSVRL